MAEMTRDFNSVFYITPLLENVVHTGSASEADGTAKLVWGCRGGAAVVTVGNVDTAECVISLTFQKSPDNSSWTDIVPIGYSSADIEITAVAALGEDNIVAFSLDELNEGGYIRVQWQVTNGKNATAFGANFVGFRAMRRPVFEKWALGEIYAVDEVVQNDSFYFICTTAFTRALAEAEVIADEAGTDSVSEPGVGTSTDTYWDIYKGATLA
jgi:hypothetical protein